jgi:CDP-diacylglycerol--serine O-phosphatidyltransferase
MVSRFNYSSFKEISMRGRISFTSLLALPLIFIMIAVNPPLVLFLIAVTYACSGPAFWLWRRQQRLARRGVPNDKQEEL